MQKFTLFIVLLLTVANSLFAQSKYTSDERKKLQEAEYAIDDYNYLKALNIYKSLLPKHKDDPKLLSNTGFCYYELNMVDSAIIYYNKAKDYYKDNLKKSDAQELYFNLGRAYYRSYDAENAKKIYETILPYVSKKQKEVLNKEIKKCEDLQSYLDNPRGMFTYKPSILNSDAPDYAPVYDYSNSILYFTSRRNDAKGKVDYDGYKPEDIYYSKYDADQFSKPKNIGSPINTEDYEATSSISPDGQYLFIYRWNYNKQGDIFVSKKIKKNKWSEPERLPKPVNTSHNETDACTNNDNSVLIFASDRPGGKGKMDLYIAFKDKSGEWTNVKNLDQINTDANERAPVLSPDQKSLYFSSDRPNGVGGYDIYVADVDSNWNLSNIRNMGFPLNTVADDLFFYPTNDPGKAFLTSKQIEGEPDIYVAIIYENDKDNIIVKGTVSDLSENDSVPIDNAKILVYDISKQYEAKNEKPYNANKYLLRLDKYSHYLIDFTAENHVYDLLKISDYQKVRIYNADLDTIISGQVKSVKNTVFENGQTNFSDMQKKEFEILSGFLQSHPDLIVDVSAWGRDDSPEGLDKERQNLIVDYLKQNGIEQDRIVTQLYENHVGGDTVFYTILSRTPKIDSLIAASQQPQGTGKQFKSNIVVDEILFKINQYKAVKYYADLDVLAQYLLDNPNAKIGIYGYTDTQGPADYNQQLSVKRANFVKNYLLQKGVKESQMVVEGRGFSKQISKNKDENGNYIWESLAYNRRVEFEVIKPGEKKGLLINKIEVPDEYALNHSKIYTINLLTSDEPVPFGHFDIDVIEVRWLNGTYSYIYGYYQSLDKAREDLKKLIDRYPEAHIFVNNFSYTKTDKNDDQ